MDEIQLRLDRLERANRRWRKIAGGVLIALVAVIVMGQSQGQSVQDTIKARTLLVVDKAGKTVVELTSAPFPTMTFHDAKGVGRIYLGLEPGSGNPRLSMSGSKGKTRASIQIEGDNTADLRIGRSLSGTISLSERSKQIAFFNAAGNQRLSLGLQPDPAGSPYLALSGEKMKGQVHLQMNGDSPFIRMHDGDGKTVFRAPK